MKIQTYIEKRSNIYLKITKDCVGGNCSVCSLKDKQVNIHKNVGR